MKKIFFLLIFLFLCANAWAVTDQDFGKLVAEVKGQDADMDQIARILKGYDLKFDALQKGWDEVKAQIDKLEKKGGADPAELAELKRRIAQAQQTANRSLAGVYRLSSIQSDGSYPDIETVEYMMTPIEKGDMSPKPFEGRVSSAIKGKGWTYLDKPPTGLGEEKVQEIAGREAKKEAEKAAVGALKDAKAYVDKKAKDTAESLTKIEEGIASLKKSLKDIEGFETRLANKADQSAVDILHNQVLDAEGNPKFATQEYVDGKLKDARVDLIPCMAKDIPELFGRVSGLEKKTATLEAATYYLSQKDWDGYRGTMYIQHGADGLRARGWSEKNIKKAEEMAAKMGKAVQATPEETAKPQPEEEAGSESEYDL